jgi:hypothetical protein
MKRRSAPQRGLAVVITSLAATTALAEAPPEDASIKVSGTLEVYASVNTNMPGNGITAYRGFDQRAGTVAVSNAALGVRGQLRGVDLVVIVQTGLLTSAIYSTEPNQPLGGAAGASDADVWRHLQQAVIGWDAHERVRVEAGVFPSPIGIETMAASEGWTFSRSNLFFGLPFYHTGARVQVGVVDGLRVSAAVVNGWNSVVDNNRRPAGYAQLAADTERVDASLLYFGGVERPLDAPEGQPWRHLVDAWVQAQVHPRVAVSVHGDLGMEKGERGVNRWVGGAVAIRGQVAPRVAVAARGDVLAEAAQPGTSPLFWPTDDADRGRLASVTGTLEYAPVNALKLRLEGRYDRGLAPMFFDRTVAEDVSTGLGIPERLDQGTVTLAAIASF